MAHRTAFVMQSTVAHVNHLLEGYIDGLNSRRPALFNIYAVCPPEHGIGDDKSVEQSKLAVESRAYPLFRFDPDAGITFSECVSLEGNPSMDTDWPAYALKYVDESGAERSMTLPMTFADFAATESRFGKQFKKAPPETWNDDMVPLAEFLEMEVGDQEGRFPYIWAVDQKNRLIRLLVTAELARSSQERKHFWQQLKDVASSGMGAGAEEEVAQRVRAEMMQKISASLGFGGASAAGSADISSAAPAAAAMAGYEPVWVETPECTACDECTTIAPKVFAYNEQKLAYVVNPKGAKFADLVKAAEKCTAGCLHPGTPWDASEAGLDRLMARAAKFN